MIIQLLFYFLFPFLFSVFSPLFPSELEVTTELITSGKQKLAFTEDGRSILVWSYNNDSTQSSDIMAQIYTSSGAIDIPQFKVNGNLAFSRQNPCIAVQSDGSFVVVWESFGQDGNMTDIYCQIFDGKANKVGSEFQINVITDGNQTSPCVSVMNDYFVVAWVGPDDSMNGIYANFFDLQGNKVEKSEFLVNENNTFLDQNSPSVVMIFESSNSSVFLGFAITWTVYEEDGTSLGVFINFFYYFFEYRMHFSTGEAKASYYNETQQQNPQIAMALTQANFIFFPYFIADVVIVWQCSEISEDIGDMLGIYAYKFQIRVYMIESGVFALELLSWMPEFKVNSYTYNSQVEPVVGFTQNNNFIVVWQSFYQDSDGWGILDRKSVV